jgi:hypothetical protein
MATSFSGEHRRPTITADDEKLIYGRVPHRMEIPSIEERPIEESPSMKPRPYTMREYSGTCDGLAKPPLY